MQIKIRGSYDNRLFDENDKVVKPKNLIKDFEDEYGVDAELILCDFGDRITVGVKAKTDSGEKGAYTEIPADSTFKDIVKAINEMVDEAPKHNTKEYF